MTSVEVCPMCDIAGCRHIREREKAKEERNQVMIDSDKTPIETLLADLKSTHGPTEAQRVAQQVSFARGQIGMGSDRDEAAYRAAVHSDDRATRLRLDQEAEDRVKRAFRE